MNIYHQMIFTELYFNLQIVIHRGEAGVAQPFDVCCLQLNNCIVALYLQQWHDNDMLSVKQTLPCEVMPLQFVLQDRFYFYLPISRPGPIRSCRPLFVWTYNQLSVSADSFYFAFHQTLSNLGGVILYNSSKSNNERAIHLIIVINLNFIIWLDLF